MANLKLLDTGYVGADDVSSQTQLSDADRAGYTGSAVTSFTLKTFGDILLSGGNNTENKTGLDTTTDSRTTLTGVKNRSYRISAILAKTIVTSGYSINNVYQLMRMERTKGLKLLYPSSTGDTLPTIVEAMGAVNINGEFADASPTDDEGTVSTTTPYVVGRVKNMTLSDLSTDNSYWKVSFDFEVSG